MQLKSVRVQNFRSVEDSGLFSLEHVTCLVGKNEAGKTAILQAIAGINPHPATPFAYELERDYPKRFLARFKERHADNEAIVATSYDVVADLSQSIYPKVAKSAIQSQGVRCRLYFHSITICTSFPARSDGMPREIVAQRLPLRSIGDAGQDKVQQRSGHPADHQYQEPERRFRFYSIKMSHRLLPPSA